MGKSKQYEIPLVLNENGEIIPKYPKNFNAKNRMKHLEKFYVNNELKKIGYSEQSPEKSLLAFKNGQKSGNPDARTRGMHEAIKEVLKEGKQVTAVVEEVDKNQTPKEKCDEELEKYKKENGRYPDWNKQKNNEKWNKK